MAHIVSTTRPDLKTAAVGDEWFNPTSNKLYKLVVYNGVSVDWQEQITSNSLVVSRVAFAETANIAVTATTALQITMGFDALHPFLIRI